MLTGSLLINIVRKGKVYPFRLTLTEDHIQLAESLIDLFKRNVGVRREKLEEENKNLCDQTSTPLIANGLTKLLMDRSEFGSCTEENFPELRRKIFNYSGAYWQEGNKENLGYEEHWKNILNTLDLKKRPEKQEEVPYWLFGDISSNQILRSAPLISAEALIHLYNYSQVQGLLLHTDKISLNFERLGKQSLRQLLQLMKFFRLLFLLEGSDHQQYRLIIDGPGSILDNSKSYGIELANFFPAILLLKNNWSLNALVQLPKKKYPFQLEINSSQGYVSSYKTTGVWFHEKIKELIRLFNDKYQGQYHAEAESEIVPLQNNEYLLPDFSVYYANTEGGEESKGRLLCKVEWIRYITENKVEWIKKIASTLPPNYIFAFKGRHEKYGGLLKAVSPHLFLFYGEFTPTGLKKAVEQNITPG